MEDFKPVSWERQELDHQFSQKRKHFGHLRRIRNLTKGNSSKSFLVSSLPQVKSCHEDVDGRKETSSAEKI